MVALTPIVTLCCTLQQLQLEGSHMFGRSAGTNPWPPSTSRHSAGGEGKKNDTAACPVILQGKHWRRPKASIISYPGSY